MVTPKQAARRARIEQAAYEVLSEVGYESASLLAIARRASASNETLYNWYGNKQTLFAELVAANARAVKGELELAPSDDHDPLTTLEALGPMLLAVVTGEKAIALNRAAAGDVADTGTLGRAIAEFGRETIAPLLGDLLARARRMGRIACNDPAEAAEVYFNLLIGDLQIRRVIGALDPLPPEAVEKRARRALRHFLALYAPSEVSSR